MTDPPSWNPSRRTLTETERRTLRAKIRSLTVRGRRASTVSLPITGGGVFVLWLWTMLASDAAWFVITGFWIVVGVAIALWVRRDLGKHGRHLDDMAQGLESALKRNAADVYDVRARAFAELEEIEDEGACYAFELEGDRLAFIQGQEFYQSARFPSLDFSLAYVLDEGGRSVEMFIAKRGAKVAPAKRIPAAIKQRLDIPEHLEMRVGTIRDLESILDRT
jgi:hypothetical protein